MKQERKTEFSPCRKYRYTLWRSWDTDQLTGCADGISNAGKFVQFVGLNPSTADETKDDPTIRKCIGFAKRWGYGAICMTNLFAFRATQPSDMKAFQYPIGEASFCAFSVGNRQFSHKNDAHIYSIANGAAMVVAAWGNHGAHLERGSEVKDFFRSWGIKLYALRVTRKGAPEHPLYIPYETEPKVFQ